MDKTICTSRDCFWIEDCRRHYDNDPSAAGKLCRDFSRDVVVKDGVRQQCPYFEAKDA